MADREAQIRILESQLADLRALKLGTPIPRFGDPAVKLTRVEARLLGCLVLHAPEFVSRHALELAMYFDTGSARSENCLSVHIAKLRRKFKRQRKPLTIECQSGFGYSLQGWAS
ncbi:MAG: helix-turn-helix domain-containing protein [Pseudomonadota bacterium]